MSSPGQGWWLASDGEWYPQQWEYETITVTVKGANLNMKEAHDKAQRMGQAGWEMVSCSIQSHTSESTGGINRYSLVNETRSVVCFMKRPIKH